MNVLSSYLIQCGNLIVAITHMFVNDNAKSYGIFIENITATKTKT